MSNINNYKVIAIATKTSYDPDSNRLCLTFEITDPEIKNKIIKNWNIDLDFELVIKEKCNN